MVEIDAGDLLRMVEEAEGPGAASLADVTLKALAELAVLMKPEAGVFPATNGNTERRDG